MLAPILWITIFYCEYSSYNFNNLAYAHIFSGTPNSVFKEKDGYRIAFLPYPAIPKIGDNNTLLNFNVQKDGNDVTNTFISLIIMDTISKYGMQFGLDQNSDGKVDVADVLVVTKSKGGIAGFIGKLFGSK